MKHNIILIAILLTATTMFAQEVKINNNLVVESDGTVRMDGTSTVWEDLRVTLDKGSSSATFDYISGSNGPQIWFFKDNASVEAMSFTVQLPHGWKEGSTIYPHMHWLPKLTATGNVEWNFEYTWANNNNSSPEVFPAITTSTFISTGPFTARSFLTTTLSASNVGIDGSGKTVSSILICRIWRRSDNPNDTYNADAGVLFLDFHYQMDTFGSRSEYTK